ncbi:DUF308 domain-containing protein [Actinomycetospora sp. OC33-EN08]|uniref:DUF308 domain-containing protein n=1 Tax=Actinomycetospora aurantiaca TaxID=3129233 RepID=A0ABU8MIM0_9PSEU
MSAVLSVEDRDVAEERAQAPLLLARALFALVWAAVLVTVGPELGVVTAVVLVLYPVGDLVLVGVDALRSPRGRAGLVANAVVSALAAVGLVVASGLGVASVLWVWGVWAVVSGAGQLVVALARRRTRRGQWPLVVSGGLSCLVGVAFVVMASGPAPLLISLAGYAVAGAVFALVGLLRLRRS